VAPGVGGDEDCLVRVSLAGICSTDLAMLDGLYSFNGIMGHEFTGVVEEGPEGLVGQRVAGEINVSCGNCGRCRAGLAKHCAQRNVLGLRGHDGIFAELVTLPARNLHLVPAGVTDEAAVFTEPLAAALDVLEQVEVTPETRVLLVGAGRLGQLIARALATTGCQLTIVVRDPAKAARLASTGARLISGNEIEDRAYDVAVECTGNQDGLAMALAALRSQGALVLKSTYPDKPQVDMGRVVVDEIRLIGSRCGPFDKALALMAARDLHLEEMIDAVYPLAEGLQALEKSRQPGILKVLIKPE
jgi:threonine dehydrogenase-like Zn-dependent dehydrogenase